MHVNTRVYTRMYKEAYTDSILGFHIMRWASWYCSSLKKSFLVWVCVKIYQDKKLAKVVRRTSVVQEEKNKRGCQTFWKKKRLERWGKKNKEENKISEEGVKYSQTKPSIWTNCSVFMSLWTQNMYFISVMKNKNMTSFLKSTRSRE